MRGGGEGRGSPPRVVDSVRCLPVCSDRVRVAERMDCLSPTDTGARPVVADQALFPHRLVRAYRASISARCSDRSGQCSCSPRHVLPGEASGAPLLRVIHGIKARGNHLGLTTRHVQADLRQAFDIWERPDAIRMDRAPLLIGSSHFDWPGTILLWLVGLGTRPVVNRTHRPTDNAMIERAHRTWRSDVLDGAIFCQTSTQTAAS
jgi:hypothetical protein